MGKLLMTEELIDKCLDLYCKSGLTRKSYRVDLLKIKKYIEEKNISLDELKHEDIKLFFNEYEKKYATESVNRCKNSIKFFISYLVKNRYLSVDSEIIVSELERKNPINKKERHLNKNEIEIFLNFLKDSARQRGEQKKTFIFLRTRDLFLFSLLTYRGLRSTECSRLKIEYVDIANKRINIPGHIRKNGGNKYHADLKVILNDELIELYEKYLIERNKLPNLNNDYIFVKPNGNPLFLFDKENNTYIAGGLMTEILKKRIKQVNIYNSIINPTVKPIDEKNSIHDLRHSCSYYLQTKGLLTLPEIASILGQKSLKSTIRYSHIDELDVEEKLNQII